MVKGRGKIAHTSLPAGLRAVLIYAIVVGLCYVFYLFIGIYNPALLAWAMPSSTLLILSGAVIACIAAMVYGLYQRKLWAYSLAVFWFSLSILLSLISLFVIDPTIFSGMRALLWVMAIGVIIIDLLVLWYLTNRKQFFHNPEATPRRSQERIFVRILGGCWIALIMISAVVGIDFYRNAVRLADASVEELADTTLIHGLVLCDTKDGQQRDICYVVLATMHPEQDTDALCGRVGSAFFRFTCYQTR